MIKQKLNEDYLRYTIGGRVINISPYATYNTRTHRSYPNYGAIWSNVGHTVVNGWISTLGR